MRDDITIDDWLRKGLEIAEENEQAKKILEATKTGYVKSEQYFRRPDAAQDERLREMAREVIFGIWNSEKRDAKLQEIYHGVLRKIATDLEAGEWPKIWNSHPIKRTVDRRVNELAEQNISFWGNFDCAPCICLKAGSYRPNPNLFSDETKDTILQNDSI